MLKKAGVVAIALGMSCMGSAIAAENKLFKDFSYDAPKANFAKAKGYYDCSQEMNGDALCLDNVDFIGHKFTQVLLFNEKKLKNVALFVEPFEQAVYASATAALAKTFSLAALADGKSQLDLIELARTTNDRNAYLTRLTNYESQGLTSGELTYTFFEGVEMKKSYTSVAVMSMDMPDTVRAAEMHVSEDGASSALVIRFSFPKLDQKQFEAAAQKPVESF